ncbi:MAG: hypothetical protein U0Z26_17560 [Anaerolineales bacterium]
MREIFGNLRPKQVELLKAIASTKQVKDDFLHKKYNEQKLWGFSEKIISKFGYDFSRGRQDKAPHPFETSFSVNDVRITNRFETGSPIATILARRPRSGHAMYEQRSTLLMSVLRLRMEHRWQFMNHNHACGKIL